METSKQKQSSSGFAQFCMRRECDNEGLELVSSINFCLRSVSGISLPFSFGVIGSYIGADWNCKNLLPKPVSNYWL